MFTRIMTILTVCFGLGGQAATAATADAVTSLTLDFLYEGFGGKTLTGGGIAAEGFVGTNDSVNPLNDSYFSISLGTTIGASDLAYFGSIGAPGDYGSVGGQIFGVSFSLLIPDPLWVRLSLVSGSVDPYSSFQMSIQGSDFSLASVNPYESPSEVSAVPLPAGMILMVSALGLLGLGRRSKANTVG